jgi:hypothetical protein
MLPNKIRFGDGDEALMGRREEMRRNKGSQQYSYEDKVKVGGGPHLRCYSTPCCDSWGTQRTTNGNAQSISQMALFSIFLISLTAEGYLKEGLVIMSEQPISYLFGTI